MRCAQRSADMNFSRSTAAALHENTHIREGSARPSKARAYKSKAQSHSPEASETEAHTRLVEAFEALSELEHASCAFDASNIVLSVLEDLIPCRASAIALYDINAHALRFVATRGIGAEARRKAEVTLSDESCIARAASDMRPLACAGTDAAFNAAMDAPEGLIPGEMLLLSVAHEGRLRGLIQLIDRRAASFTDADRALLTYVADRFAAFFER